MDKNDLIIAIVGSAIGGVIVLFYTNSYKSLKKWLIRKRNLKKYKLHNYKKVLQWYSELGAKDELRDVVEGFVHNINLYCGHIKNNVTSYLNISIAYNEFKSLDDLPSFFETTVRFIKDNSLLNEINSIYEICYEFIESLRLTKIKSEAMESGNIYVDSNDKKLKKDINEYEPYLGYWSRSDEWIIGQMKKQVRKKRKANTNLNILDIGTGNGRVVCSITQEDDWVCLIDYDEDRLQTAGNEIKDKTNNIQIINSRFEDIASVKSKYAFFEHGVDVVVCSHVIQHNSTGVLDFFFREISNLLLPGGILFLLFPVSRSQNEEYVVHGMEFDVFKLNKDSFLKCKQQKSVHDLNKTLKSLRLKSSDVDFDDSEDNSGFYLVKDWLSRRLLYELSERENIALLYKRVPDKGLVCSISTKHVQVFLSRPEDVVELINKTLSLGNNGISGIPVDSTIECNILSQFWLVSMSGNSLSYLFKNDGDRTTTVYRVHRVIVKHRVYNDQLNTLHIPIEFAEVLPKSHKKYRIRRISNSMWFVKDSEDDKIASIYRTESNYSLVLEQQPGESVNISAEELFVKKLPGTLLRDYFKGYENEDDISIDPEINDGWIIRNKEGVNLYARYDYDWIRIFKIESIFMDNSLSEGKLGNRQRDALNLELWNEKNIFIKREFDDRIRNIILQGESIAVLPAYRILRLTNQLFGTYFVYRDKKYNRLSNRSFNQLCINDAERLKILPTHRFVIKALKDQLKKYSLWVKSITLYHSFHPKYCFLDRIIFRDKFFNILPLKYVKRIHRTFNIQDTLFILKKKK